MKCFYHNSVDAIAICKNCNRGVCPDCSFELENGIACKDRCENEVRVLNELIHRNKTTHLRASSAFRRNALIFLMMGIIFAVYGIFSLSSAPSLGWFTILLGAVFLIGAVFYYSSGRKYARLEK